MNGQVATRALAVCDAVIWIAKLNALWLVCTLLGGVLLGIGPSTVAAFAVARRHHQGDESRLVASFWASYRREFLRANALILPVIFVGVMLALNYRFFAASSAPGSSAITGAIIVVSILGAGAVCVLLPMFSHYDLPLLSYFSKSSRFALRSLPSTALLLFVTTAIGFASYAIPGLLLFISFGAWVWLDSYLCLKFFDANEVSLSRGVAAPEGSR